MLYKFQPFNPDKQLGKEYNAHCALVPNPEDWILILDYDAMVLDPRAYNVIHHVIQDPGSYDIFTAVTNRVGYSWQMDGMKMNSDDKLTNHLLRARERYETFGNTVSPTLNAAGFFLLFRKQYWIEHPFQESIRNADGRLFDWVFTREACQLRRIGLLEGVYVWHTYRLLQKDYRDTTHLK